MSEIKAPDVVRQQSVRSTMSMNTDYDSDDDMDDYYNNYDEDFDVSENEDGGSTSDTNPSAVKDPECFRYSLMDTSNVKKLFQDSTDRVRTACDVTYAHAQMMLERDDWNVDKVVNALKRNNSHLLQNNNDQEFECVKKKRKTNNQNGECMVCYVTVDQLKSLDCGHGFCAECWIHHIETQINSGVFGNIPCMEPDCKLQIPEDFVMATIGNQDLKMKYQEFTFRERIVKHPELKFCPGVDCNRIVQAPTPMARRVNCDKCNSSFCFSCSQDYHAPMGCQDIKKWLQKCEDDSETANYIAANTKDCPKCNVCIEKNGGCNHMQCFKCRYDFCWICLNPWSAHDSYYECSKYKEDNESTSARSALEKYLFYFQRWENHSKSLTLEEETRSKIQGHIETKVMNCQGTWIDWQYLLDACTLLHRCRYTLKYTYPYAYFLEAGATKDCFEHIQAQLEMEVENLSWKVERAQITDRGDLERQMDVAEKRRLTLLQDYL